MDVTSAKSVSLSLNATNALPLPSVTLTRTDSAFSGAAGVGVGVAVGAGVAVAGAFSLVRFRSVPGTAKEIGTIILAMGAGLICGMGYLGYAVLFSLILGACMLVYNMIGFGSTKKACLEKTLRITIPEDLNYTEVFTDLMEKYTSQYELVQVKTTNLGSLFKLVYNLRLKDASQEKELIDALRCRNGNLEIQMSRQENNMFEL